MITRKGEMIDGMEEDITDLMNELDELNEEEHADEIWVIKRKIRQLRWEHDDLKYGPAI